jgi:dephospho-CoA kinase
LACDTAVTRLAVVGPIASGKSTVLGLLRERGAATCSADELARELTAPGQPTLEAVLAEFGEAYRQEDGSLDRRQLGELIFGSTEARERLEAILHPPILGRIETWLDALSERTNPPPVGAVEVLRLPCELRARELFDVVWLCRAPDGVRLSRLMARDGLSEAEARRRLEVQRSQEIDDCDPHVLLDTAGTPDEICAQVDRAWARL